MDIYAELAQKTVRDYLEKQQLPKVQNQAPELLTKRAGCFVSIHQKDNNELRGCIGTVTAVHKNLAGEIIANALEAAFHDPRFSPITKSEIDDLKYSVDVLSDVEAIKSEKDLNPKKYGLIVRSKDLLRQGLLLPNLDGIDDIETQMQIAREKAGILEDEEVLLYRFQVDHHK